MQGIRRRVVYVTLYELIAIGATSVGLAAFADSSAERAGVAAVVSSAVAVAWNVVFNTLFERWEARQTVRGRGLARNRRQPGQLPGSGLLPEQLSGQSGVDLTGRQTLLRDQHGAYHPGMLRSLPHQDPGSPGKLCGQCERRHCQGEECPRAG